MTSDLSISVNNERAGRPHPVTVTINNQSVELPDRDLTGLEIKQAAIAQGVQVQIGFQLSRKHKDRWDVIGDTDVIHAKKSDEFLIVAPDDNS